MSAYKIMSEEALEKLICSNCNNYLSYGTPKIGSKKLICGRCDQEEGILPLFNDNIANYLFPCINRFDNCLELLDYSQVQEHEKKCNINIKHKCTECDYNGNGCQVYHHFIKQHPNHVLKFPIFNIYLLEPKKFNYLYRTNNNLFTMTYEVIKSKYIVKVLVKGLGQEQLVKSQVILASPVKETQYLESEFNTELNVELDIFKHIKKHNENTITCRLNVSVCENLFTLKKPNPNESPLKRRYRPCLQHERKRNESTEKKSQNNDNQLRNITNAVIRNLLPKLICSNCDCYVIPPIYKCLSNHVRCEDCSSSFCRACDDVVNWSRAIDLEVFHEFMPLPCRWKCKTTLLASELRNHEKTCTKRLYKCTEEWCSWSGSITSLVNHWHSSTKIYSDTHTVYGFSENLVDFFLIYNCELFYIRMDPLKVNGRHVHIRKVSNVSPTSDVYSARVLLTHKCDDTLIEKTSYIKFGGISLLGRRLFDSFGQCKNYKIMFTVSLLS